MNYPFREHLEVEVTSVGKWLRCIHCGHRLCALGENWKSAARRRTFAPTQAGPLMKVLEGRYVFEKLYCPSCGVLFNADMVEERHEA
jgi:acetone carboxylase gamma subunit